MRSTRRTSRSPRSRCWRSSPNDTYFPLPPTATLDLGTHVYITNNNFFDNFDAAMQIEPNGLLAGDPLTPLVSGHPFFRGNVMQGNGIDGLAVVTDRVYLDNANDQLQLHRARSRRSPRRRLRQPDRQRGLGLDRPDLRPPGHDRPRRRVRLLRLRRGWPDAPVPSTTLTGRFPTPVVSLTIQAALPGTLLADGETIPSPGQSVIVKMLNDETPNDVGAANLATTYGSTGIRRVAERRGRVRRRRRRRRRSAGAARWSIRVRTPSSASWASRATRRPASSACR